MDGLGDWACVRDSDGVKVVLTATHAAHVVVVAF